MLLKFLAISISWNILFFLMQSAYGPSLCQSVSLTGVSSAMVMPWQTENTAWHKEMSFWDVLLIQVIAAPSLGDSWQPAATQQFGMLFCVLPLAKRLLSVSTGSYKSNFLVLLTWDFRKLAQSWGSAFNQRKSNSFTWWSAATGTYCVLTEVWCLTPSMGG